MKISCSKCEKKRPLKKVTAEVPSHNALPDVIMHGA